MTLHQFVFQFHLKYTRAFKHLHNVYYNICVNCLVSLQRYLLPHARGVKQALERLELERVCKMVLRN